MICGMLACIKHTELSERLKSEI